MYIRVIKARFAPITKRYKQSGFEQIEQKAKVELGNETTSESVRGVVAGLHDKAHNGDYKVKYASDPLLVVHAKQHHDHQQIKEQLENLSLWLPGFNPIGLPRQDQARNYTYAPGFKSLPKSHSQIDRFISTIEDASTRMCFTNEHSVEATVPDVQQTLSTFSAEAGATEAEQSH